LLRSFDRTLVEPMFPPLLGQGVQRRQPLVFGVVVGSTDPVRVAPSPKGGLGAQPRHVGHGLLRVVRMLPGTAVQVRPVRGPRPGGPARVSQHRQPVAHSELGRFVPRRAHCRPCSSQRRQAQVAVFGRDSDGWGAVAWSLFRVALGAVRVVVYVAYVDTQAKG